MKHHRGTEIARACLKEGNYVEVMREVRRPGIAEAWSLLSSVHSDEAARMSEMIQLVGKASQTMVAVLNTSSGMIGVVELAPTEPQLDLEAGGTAPADPLAVARERADLTAKKVHRSNSVAGVLLEKIATNQITSYEELLNAVPPDVDMEFLKPALAMARKGEVEYETRAGSLKYGGKAVPRTLPSGNSVTMLADIRLIDADSKPDGAVAFKGEVIRATIGSAGLPFSSRERVTALLATPDNAKALALMHLSSVYKLKPILEVEAEYSLVDKRFDHRIKKISNEEELLDKARDPKSFFSELF